MFSNLVASCLPSFLSLASITACCAALRHTDWDGGSAAPIHARILHSASLFTCAQGLASLLEGCIAAQSGMEALLHQQSMQEKQLRAGNAALKVCGW